MKFGLNIRRNVTTTVAAFFVNIALTFIGYRLVVQQGGTTALGLWASLSAAIYVIRLGDVGMGSAAERHIAALDASQFPAKARGYLNTAFLLNAILFILLATVGWALFNWKIDWVVPGDSATQAEALAILPLMLAGFIVSNLSTVVTGGLRGLHIGYQTAYLSIAGGLLQMGIVLALVPSLGVAGLAWGQLVQYTFTGIVAWTLFTRHLRQYANKSVLPLPPNNSTHLLRELLSFSLKAQAVNLANGLLEPASKLVVAHSAGISALGIYEIAYKLIALPRNAVVSGVLSITPALTNLLKAEPKEARKLYHKSKKTVALGGGAVILLTLAISPIASSLLINHPDRTLLELSAILAFGFWLNTIGATAYSVGFASSKLGGNFACAAIGLIALYCTSIVLNSASALYGPVIASSVAMAISGVTVMIMNERLVKAHTEEQK